MDILYDKGLALLPKAEGAGRVLRRFHEQYYWFLALAMLLLVTEMLFPERKKSANRVENKIPQAPKPAIQSPAASIKSSATALLVGFLLLPLVARASPGSALREYESGNYTNALSEYTRLAEVQTNDLRLVFNAGDAAYRATNFDLAQNLFTQVSLSPDLKLQQKAFYNLGNTQFQQAKLAKDLDDLQDGLETTEKTYQRAVMLNTNDADAIFNWNFTKQAIEQLKAFKEAMRRAKGDADAAVRRSEFHRALEIMMPLQKTIAAKQFQDFTKKLKDIDDIQNPQNSHQP
jgi:tetratricopeptide (TPR) repeat protein